MIAFTYVASGVLLTGSGALFAQGTLSAAQQTFAWSVIFFFASAAASSAYLTVSETFPLEIRALAIAFFYAIGTGIGGIAGPWLFGATDRHWLALERVRRLFGRRRVDDRGRIDCMVLRGFGRAQAARISGAAALLPGLNYYVNRAIQLSFLRRWALPSAYEL